MSHANLQVLHYAVLENAPDIVRILMAHGADARDGVYPHRDATTAYAIAVQRGYDRIVRVIEEEEQKRRDLRSGMRDAPPTDDLYRAIEKGDVDRVIAMVDENPAWDTRATPLSACRPCSAASHGRRRRRDAGRATALGCGVRRRPRDRAHGARTGGLAARRPALVHGPGTPAANVDTRFIRRRSAARRLSRLLPPCARTLRSQSAWASDRRAAVWIDDAAQRRGAWRHDGEEGSRN
jgi:hypothetical protein